MRIDKNLLEDLLSQVQKTERKRINYDLRTSLEDGSQRMLNALLLGTVVPIHKHPMSTENVLVLRGELDEILCNAAGKEIERIHLNPSIGQYGCVIPKGVWHSIEVYTPTVLFEAKDGKYGEDGTTVLTSEMTK